MIYVNHSEEPSFECLNCLIDAGSVINQVDIDGNTLFILAASNVNCQLNTLLSLI